MKDAEKQTSRTGAGMVSTKSPDPGDETERNYRYQHSYGVIILAGVRKGLITYKSIYCEHHEDFLCECENGKFDAYQLKTRRPELGAWTMVDEAFVSSIARFCDLIVEFEEEIDKFYFVSNTEFSNPETTIKNQEKVGKSPIRFLQHIKSCSAYPSIQEPYRTFFIRLVAEIACTEETLFTVLRKLDLIIGPARKEMDASLAHEHIGGLDECKHLPPPELDKIRDDLVAKFHRAASLQVTDPFRHIRSFFSGTPNPEIAAKQIVCAEIAFVVPLVLESFHHIGAPTLQLGEPQDHNVLEKKLSRGGLTEIVDYMKELDISAEYNLLSVQAKDAVNFPSLLKQIEQSVHGECLEAYISCRTPDKAFGDKMFTQVSSRLRRLEANRREMLRGQPYETLMGVAAMLTNACRVWWSERFPLDSGQ